MTDTVSKIDRLRKSGDLLAAFDVAMGAITAGSDDLDVKHRAVLCLSRGGSHQQAAKLFRELELSEHRDDPKIASLSARIAKDRALQQEGVTRVPLLRTAASEYLKIYRNSQGDSSYTAINAATLSFLAGQGDEARSLAEDVIGMEGRDTAEDHTIYYEMATLAEAWIILGDLSKAADYIATAKSNSDRQIDSMASTRRQLSIICAAKDIDTAILDPLRPPRVAHYSGHRISNDNSGRFPACDEEFVRDNVRQIVRDREIGFLFGSLASGADIICVEEGLALGCDVRVVLPFRTEDFIRESVAGADPKWEAKFREITESGKVTVSYATEGRYRGQSLIYSYAARHAMGLAALRARQLDAEIQQIAVWDGAETGLDAGTSADIAYWKQTLGSPVNVVTPPNATTRNETAAPQPEQKIANARELHAMVFADVKGFSKLDDAKVPDFVDLVLNPLSAIMDTHQSGIKFRNTWGDGLFLVFSDINAAAHCALDMQAVLADIEYEHHDMPADLSLRIGCHFGLVFPMRDPVTNTDGFFGANVNKAARIEPITPPGEVYVSEEFAARLSLTNQEFNCEYVGEVATAKGYGVFCMYLLKRG